MKLRIKKAELVPDKWGSTIKISMVGIYDENGKWIKWIKLNEALLNILLNAEIDSKNFPL